MNGRRLLSAAAAALLVLSWAGAQAHAREHASRNSIPGSPALVSEEDCRLCQLTRQPAEPIDLGVPLVEGRPGLAPRVIPASPTISTPRPLHPGRGPPGA